MAAMTTTMDTDSKMPFKIKDVTRNIKKAVVASSLEEIRSKVAEKFEKTELLPTIHLDSDGTEIDDEEYFRTLDANTELIAVFPGEHWIDPTHYVTITSQREPGDTTDAAAETARIKHLVGQLQSNLCNVSVMSDSDLDSLSNMDPNSLVDITGKDFMDQLKDSGRSFYAKRTAEDRINLLKLLKDGAIFCSESYPEDAEAIDMEISRQLNIENAATDNVTLNRNNIAQTTDATVATAATTTTTKATTTITINTKTIDQVQNAAKLAACEEQATVNSNLNSNSSTNTNSNSNSILNSNSKTHTNSHAHVNSNSNANSNANANMNAANIAATATNTAITKALSNNNTPDI